MCGTQTVLCVHPMIEWFDCRKGKIAEQDQCQGSGSVLKPLSVVPPQETEGAAEAWGGREQLVQPC